MKIVEYSKGSITEVENVFKVVESGAQGPQGEPGTIGTLDLLDPKATPVDADLMLVGDSADSFANKATTWANIKATLLVYFTAAFNLIYQAIFNTQNLGTILTDKTINATSFSTITGDFAASFTATFEGFTASRKSVLLHLVVSGGGTPTITIAGYTFTFMTTANLTAMADGTYQVVVNNPLTDTTAFVYVKLAP